MRSWQGDQQQACKSRLRGTDKAIQGEGLELFLRGGVQEEGGPPPPNGAEFFQVAEGAEEKFWCKLIGAKGAKEIF